MQSAHCYTAAEQVVVEVQSVAWTPAGPEGSGSGLPASPVSNPRLRSWVKGWFLTLCCELAFLPFYIFVL